MLFMTLERKSMLKTEPSFMNQGANKRKGGSNSTKSF
jgi:hypothetical protein